jgi:hypothetical protein
MKKNLQSLAAAAASLLLIGLASCQKNELDSPDANKATICIQANIPQTADLEDNKISLSELSQGGLALAWQGEDQLRVIGGSTQSIFSIKEGFSEKDATFQGTAVEGETFSILYPSKYAGVNYILGRNYSGQVQNGNGNTDHLEYNALLSEVNNYENISFSSEWAQANGGSFNQNGAILFHLQLPASIDAVTKVVLSSNEEELFFTSNDSNAKANSLAINLENVSVSENKQILKAYMMLSWQPITTTESTSFTVDVYDNNGKYYSKSFTPGVKTFTGGMLNTIQLNANNWTVKDNTKGSGTQEDPYKLSTAEDLLNMKSQLVQYSTVYFSLQNDIDMASVENWTPLNNGDPDYDRYVDFEGNGHIIKNLTCTGAPYASFFGVLHGACRNVGFVNANVKSTNAGGIIAGYLGLRKPANEQNIGIVENCFTTGQIEANPGGGIAGYLGAPSGERHCTIKNSYSTAKVTGKSVGGVAGAFIGKGEITNCYSAGMVRSANGYANGVVASKENIASGLIIFNAVAWNSCVTGGLNSTLYGLYDVSKKKNSADKECFYVSDQTTYPRANDADSTSNRIMKTTAELQTLFTGLESWSSTLVSGYPVLSWVGAREDVNDICDFASLPKAFEGGNGTESSPYEIAYDYQMLNIDRIMQSKADNEVSYFKITRDLDMSGVKNWICLNNVGSYLKLIHLDGTGKTVSNFDLNYAYGTYKGIFGIFGGTLKNITFDNITLNNTNRAAGLICAWAGLNSEAISATFENVHITNGSITQNHAAQVGGFAGKARVVTFTNCSYAGSITNKTCATASGDQGTGGLAGWSIKVDFTNCQFDGTINGARLTGGIVGFGNTNTNLRNCSSAGTIQSSVLNSVNAEGIGGIAGWWGGANTDVVSGCHSTANISNSGSSNHGGGILGMVGSNGVLIEKCYSTGNININQNVGGIVGYSESSNMKIDQCYSSGTITARASNVGGIIGGTKAGGLVQNCYSTGSMNVPNGQVCGGIGGEVNTNTQIKYCYSSATIDGQRVLGGIAGRACSTKWDVTLASGNTIESVIAWNPHIICTDTRDASKAGGSGAIVGFTSAKNILKNGYRLSTMDFQTSDSSFTAVDQPDCDGTNWTKGTTPGTGSSYQMPYHGKAAAADATITSIARDTLGWSSSIWDFNGTRPTLKANAESAQ